MDKPNEIMTGWGDGEFLRVFYEVEVQRTSPNVHILYCRVINWRWFKGDAPLTVDQSLNVAECMYMMVYKGRRESGRFTRLSWDKKVAV